MMVKTAVTTLAPLQQMKLEDSGETGWVHDACNSSKQGCTASVAAPMSAYIRHTAAFECVCGMNGSAVYVREIQHTMILSAGRCALVLSRMGEMTKATAMPTKTRSARAMPATFREKP